MSQQDYPLPSHVPAELAVEFPLTTRKIGYVHPHKEIIPKLHQGRDIVYATNIFPVPPGGGWVVRRAEDLKHVYEDTENFIKKGNAQFASMLGESWDAIPTELDPPKHTAFRRALEPIFSPRRMAALEQKVSGRAEELIAKFKDKGHVEFIKEFAVPFPVSIVLDLLGLPQDRMDEFMGWEHNLLHTGDVEARRNAVKTLKDYLYEVIADRKKNPGDDLISNALTLESEGRKWTEEEVFGHCFNLFIGGLDTVTANLGWHFHHLATHPEDQRTLRENPGMIEQAVLELMRAYAAVTTIRICAKETELCGVTIKPGDRVALCTPLGSNDPEAFEDPTKVILDRRPAHLSFGHGIHRCLGAHLARRELKVAITDMLAELPEFRLKEGFEVPYLMSNVMHVDKLELVWDK
ncbi:MAG: cytochrome [Porticoccaceae bacterium]|nr:cytochrome [Porticoccaceae bacterium]